MGFAFGTHPWLAMRDDRSSAAASSPAHPGLVAVLSLLWSCVIDQCAHKTQNGNKVREALNMVPLTVGEMHQCVVVASSKSTNSTISIAGALCTNLGSQTVIWCQDSLCPDDTH
jgi:hypothetical protein